MVKVNSTCIHRDVSIPEGAALVSGRPTRHADGLPHHVIGLTLDTRDVGADVVSCRIGANAGVPLICESDTPAIKA